MTQPTSVPTPERTFSLLHIIMVAGVATLVLILAIVRSMVPYDPMTDLVPVLRIVAGVLLVAAYVVMRVFRADIVPLVPGGDRRAWWRQQGTKALIIWVLAEGAAMIGTVFWFITGDLALLVGVAGVALVLLVMNRPAKLMGE